MYRHERKDADRVGAGILSNDIAMAGHVCKVCGMVDIEQAAMVDAMQVENMEHTMCHVILIQNFSKYVGRCDDWKMGLAVEQHEINAKACTQRWSCYAPPSI